MNKLGFIWDVVKTLIGVISEIFSHETMPNSIQIINPDTSVGDVSVSGNELTIQLHFTMDLVLAHESKLSKKLMYLKKAEKSERKSLKSVKAFKKGVNLQMKELLDEKLTKVVSELGQKDFKDLEK